MRVYERDQLMYPAARSLSARIMQNGAQTIFFMTWGYRNGLDVSGLESFDEMQDVISESYIEIAEEMESLIVPVGVAWQKAVMSRPQLILWEDDEIHPSVQGSYLSAVCYMLLSIRKALWVCVTGRDYKEIRRIFCRKPLQKLF